MASYLYAGTDEGVVTLKSEDGCPEDSDRIYAAQKNGDLFGSFDSGNSWRKLDISLPALSDMKSARA